MWTSVFSDQNVDVHVCFNCQFSRDQGRVAFNVLMAVARVRPRKHVFWVGPRTWRRNCLLMAWERALVELGMKERRGNPWFLCRPHLNAVRVGEGHCFAHTPSIAFRHLPPKEGCCKPALGVCALHWHSRRGGDRGREMGGGGWGWAVKVVHNDVWIMCVSPGYVTVVGDREKWRG